MEGLFDSLGGIFVMLVILSLIVITGGFLMESLGSDTPDSDPPLYESSLFSAILNLGFAAVWSYLILLGDRTEPDWFMIGIVGLLIFAGLAHLYRYVTVDLKTK